MALADVLVGDGGHRHVTAESLFERVKDAGDKVSLATVYNTLGAFCDAGLMQEITVDGSKSYFDTNTHEHPHFFWEDTATEITVDGSKSYFDTNTHEHPHFFWEDTATLSDAPAEQLQISQLPNAPDGAEIVSVDVVIRLRKKTILKP